MKEQELRGEFKKLNHCGSLQVIEDFWLSKREAELKEIRDRIEKEMWYIIPDQADGEILLEQEYYNKAIEKVLSIIDEKLK